MRPLLRLPHGRNETRQYLDALVCGFPRHKGRCTWNGRRQSVAAHASVVLVVGDDRLRSYFFDLSTNCAWSFELVCVDLIVRSCDYLMNEMKRRRI